MLVFISGLDHLINPAGFVAEPVDSPTPNGFQTIALSSTMSRLQPPQHSNEVKVAFPAEHVLLLTFNRPKQLNAMTPRMSEDLKTLLNWFEDEPSLWYVFYSHCGHVFSLYIFPLQGCHSDWRGKNFLCGSRS